MKYLLISLVFLLTSCRKYEQNKPTEIIFLGHKGAGSNNFNDINLENSLPSIKEAVLEVDGVELDIEMSLDNTIYLYHDVDLNSLACSKSSLTRIIPEMRDIDIEGIDFCHLNKKDRIYRFSDVINFWNQQSRNFHISLDVKVSFGRNFFDRIGGRALYLERLAESLSKTIGSSDNTNKIFIEFDSQDFLRALKKFDNTKSIITCYRGDGSISNHIEHSLRLGYTGISINYTKVDEKSIADAKNRGLFVQIWTPYNKTELLKSFEMNPHVIQTDNKFAKRILRVE